MYITQKQCFMQYDYFKKSHQICNPQKSLFPKKGGQLEPK